MIEPVKLEAQLQRWADMFPSRSAAALELAGHLDCTVGTARGYIDYRLPKASYEVAYAVWKFLEQQQGEPEIDGDVDVEDWL